MWDLLSHFTLCIFFFLIPFESPPECRKSIDPLKRLVFDKMKGGVSKKEAKKLSQQEKDRQKATIEQK
jgi:hypothetical protein